MPAVGQGLGNRTSTLTAFLRGASRVHDDHNHSSLFRFEGEDRQELVPASIGNTLGQALVADAPMRFGDQEVGSVPVLTATLLAVAPALAPPQKVFRFPEIAWIVH